MTCKLHLVVTTTFDHMLHTVDARVPNKGGGSSLASPPPPLCHMSHVTGAGQHTAGQGTTQSTIRQIAQALGIAVSATGAVTGTVSAGTVVAAGDGRQRI